MLEIGLGHYLTVAAILFTSVAPRSHHPEGVRSGTFERDDLSSVVGEQLGRIRSHEDRREIQDSYSLKQIAQLNPPWSAHR